MRLLPVVVLLSVGLGLAPSAGANLIQNGDFGNVVAGSAVPAAWTGTNFKIVSDPSTATLGMVGAYASLTPGGSGAILSQGFDVAGVSQIALSFNWFLKNSGAFRVHSEFGSIVNAKTGEVLYSLILPIQGAPAVGTYIYGTYTAVLNLPALPIEELRVDFTPFAYQAEAGIDNVSVTAVPEPATLLLLGSGLVGLGGVAWRRNRKS